MRALCKLNGMLVIAKLKPATQDGHCPLCYKTSFREHNGWIECDNCYQYAILQSDLEKVKNEQSTN